ncbi:MAG: 2-oxoacid:acceptor oxidoreductase family protein [Phycisphaerales bacterium]|nr:2-oxoacid:acceptor oxidoreductase family protein [Phycisphaerales bacterium]
MIEFTLYGRGGQGGVTLAKLIASAFFERGKHVQAFGVYAAERSGAPVQAYVRVDDEEITNHNQVRQPDHVVVLDRTLIGPRVVTGMRANGWLILNAADPPEKFAEHFPGRRVATVDATAIAAANGLGTRAVPIVNTTLLGAVIRVLGLTLDDVDHALAHTGFGGANVTAARQAFETVRQATLPGTPTAGTFAAGSGEAASILDPNTGGLPRIHTGDWATRQPQRRQLTPPCNQGCPAGNNVRDFVQAVGQQEYDEALRIILETSPFPAVCGRVCPAPCMEVCNRGQYDGAVNVRDLERYVGDHTVRPHASRPTRPERIAVIGSGPAGLSCTYHLARLGYPVTIFEADSELGGVMRTGIPAYRLPRDVLDREISFILQHGVTVKTGQRISRQRLLELSHEYDALFVGTGLQELRGLNLGRTRSATVIQGIEFLDRVRHGEVFMADQRVVVLGGGNTAMDAARSAKRCGARHVVVAYRRTRAEMPAIKEEIDEALEEGIELLELVTPLGLSDRPTGAVLTCQRNELGPPDASGRRAPVPIETEDAIFEIPCDRVILALGQSADLSIFPEGSDVHDGERLAGLTGAPIFAGGDFATNDGTVTAAIGSGRRAALHIHRTLTGEDLFDHAEHVVAGPEAMTMHVFDRRPPLRGDHVAPPARVHSFTEVRLGLHDEPGRPAAALEAGRCLSCGVCNECDRCLSYCPEGVMVHRGNGEYRFDYDYCKGCGICASQCPRGVVYMAEL